MESSVHCEQVLGGFEKREKPPILGAVSTYFLIGAVQKAPS